MKNKRKISVVRLFVFGVIFQTGLFTACMPQEAPPEKEIEFAVNSIKSVRGEINDYLEVNGDVQALASIDVFADASFGTISAINVSLGEYVRAGQTIAKVDPSRPGQRFEPSPVRAPISGTITSVMVRVGSTISKTVPVAKISRTSELEIVCHIAERFIERIRRGLSAVVRFDAFPDDVFYAKVNEMSPSLDPLTRTMEIKLVFTGNAEKVKAGMFANVKLIIESKKDIVKIPSYCMVRRFDKLFVFVIKEDLTVERREITPGIEIDSKLEVVEGVRSGELLVAQGQRVLEEGAKVRIIEELEPLSVQDTVE